MSFVITFSSDGSQFECQENQTVLDAALEQGSAISYGCRNGQCGSCLGQIVKGEISYPEGQPDGITDEQVAEGKSLFCKAVPQTDLTIDVQTVTIEPEIVVKTLPAKVAEIDHLTDDVIRLMLQLPAVEKFHFMAGQWVYIVMKDGKKRAFSLANAPNDKNQLELQIRHAVGGVFTDFVFNQLNEGALLRMEGPHGTFFYQEDEQPILLVAGGTGFAPIKGIFEQISAQPLKQPIHLFWGSRAKKDLYQESLVEEWVKQYGIEYTPVLSDPIEEDNWNGETGFVHQAVLKAYPNLQDHAVYMAGPPQMIESCKNDFIEAGLPDTRLYYDSFDYSTDALNAMKGK